MSYVLAIRTVTTRSYWADEWRSPLRVSDLSHHLYKLQMLKQPLMCRETIRAKFVNNSSCIKRIA